MWQGFADAVIVSEWLLHGGLNHRTFQRLVELNGARWLNGFGDNDAFDMRVRFGLKL